MYRILYIQPIHPDGMNYLRAKPDYEVRVSPATDRETLKKEIADTDVIITRLTVVDAELMSYAKHLKAVCKHGVGIDNIDTEYCRQHGIAVLTTGDANSSTVAEQAMLAIGALLRKTVWLDGQMRKGNWSSRDCSDAVDLKERTVGLIGYGRIGKCLAQMASKGFDMKVCVYDPYARREDVESQGYHWFDHLSDMLPVIDILSPHVPLTPETSGMIGATEMDQMKKGSFIINFARGGVIDEKALYEHLASGHLAGAALDVYEHEPPDAESNPLFKLDNVILSPHCGTFTEDSRRRMSLRLAQEIEKTLS